jgi:hypothetical protein
VPGSYKYQYTCSNMTTYSSTADSFMNGSSRSPRSGRQPQLQRQTSRPFDTYGTMPTGATMYPTDDTMSFSRFDGGRNPFNAPMQSGQINGSQFAYDINASQTWNSNGNSMQSFGGNHSGFMGPSGSLAGQSRLKPSRGRTVLPNVRKHFFQPAQINN